MEKCEKKKIEITILHDGADLVYIDTFLRLFLRENNAPKVINACSV